MTDDEKFARMQNEIDELRKRLDCLEQRCNG